MTKRHDAWTGHLGRLALLPVLTLFFIFLKYFIKGLNLTDGSTY